MKITVLMNVQLVNNCLCSLEKKPTKSLKLTKNELLKNTWVILIITIVLYTRIFTRDSDIH